MPEVDFTMAATRRRGPSKRRTIGLAELRQGHDVTQLQVSERTGMSQPEVSKFEAREDHRVSMLKKYAQALGGELQLAIVIGGREYPIPG